MSEILTAKESRRFRSGTMLTLLLPPPRSIGISNLASKRRKIEGPQQLRGKIFFLRDLALREGSVSTEPISKMDCEVRKVNEKAVGSR